MCHQLGFDERVHTQCNLWAVNDMFLYDLLPTSPQEKFHSVPTSVLIVTMTSIKTHSVLKTHSFCR